MFQGFWRQLFTANTAKLPLSQKHARHYTSVTLRDSSHKKSLLYNTSDVRYGAAQGEASPELYPHLSTVKAPQTGTEYHTETIRKARCSVFEHRAIIFYMWMRYVASLIPSASEVVPLLKGIVKEL